MGENEAKAAHQAWLQQQQRKKDKPCTRREQRMPPRKGMKNGRLNMDKILHKTRTKTRQETYTKPYVFKLRRNMSPGDL